MCVVCLDTIMWSVYKSWGGGVPTLDRDRSGPRLRQYIYNFYSSSPQPTRFNHCSGSFSSSLYPTTSPSVDVCSHIASLLNPLPTSSPGAKPVLLDFVHTRHPPPATRQPPPLDSTPCAACLRLPPFTVSFRPTFATLGLRPGPCQTLGVWP